jgi:hypothetical protein
MSIIIGGVECKLVPDAAHGNSPKCYRKELYVPSWFPAPPETPPFLQPSFEEGHEDSGNIETLKDPAPSLYPRESPKYQGFRPGAQFPKFWIQYERLHLKSRIVIFRFLYGENSENIVARYNFRRFRYTVPRPVVARGRPLPRIPIQYEPGPQVKWKHSQVRARRKRVIFEARGTVSE